MQEKKTTVLLKRCITAHLTILNFNWFWHRTNSKEFKVSKIQFALVRKRKLRAIEERTSVKVYFIGSSCCDFNADSNGRVQDKLCNPYTQFVDHKGRNIQPTHHKMCFSDKDDDKI